MGASEGHKGGDVCPESLMVSSSCGRKGTQKILQGEKIAVVGEGTGTRLSSESQELLTSVSWSLWC